MASDSLLTTNDSPRSPKLIAVIAATPAGVIGIDGGMPWTLSSDLQRFKRSTMGGVVLMGRKTFESIGRALPGRFNLVVTRQSNWSHEGVTTVAAESSSQSLDEAVQLALRQAVEDKTDVYIIGGAEIYRQLIDRCDEIWLTQVWSAVQGDTNLEICFDRWRTIETLWQPAGKRDSAPTRWNRLVRAS